MKKLNLFKVSMIALCGAALTLTSCGGGQSGQGADSTAVKTTDMKKAPYQKKYTNADFYDAQGNFKQDVAKEAFLDMFAYYDVPFTPLMEKDIWFTDFGLGDFENVGMGGIFWINDSTYGYFSHSIYLLPGQMIPEHKHVKTAFPAKQESWMVDKGWVYNFSEVGEPTEDGRFALKLYNRLIAGEEIEWISPNFPYKKETGYSLSDEEGRPLTRAGHGQTDFISSCHPIAPGDIIRKTEEA